MTYSTEYMRQHVKIKRERGPAAVHRCVKCGCNATQWAWIHDMDRNNVMSYMPMCTSCHRIYDHSVDSYAESKTKRKFDLHIETAAYYIEGKYPSWVNRTDMCRDAFSNNMTTPELDAVMKHLCDNTVIESRVIKVKRGRPRREYRLRKD
jgi:hypothetical protein